MKRDDLPLVSVAMGIRYQLDNLDLLQRSIESILNQTYCRFELLICDDGSSPGALRTLESYQDRDGRVHLLRPGNKLDLASKLNVCLQEAKGLFIARMDDDDYSHRDRFEKQLQILDAEPDIAFVGCNVRLWREGEICGVRRFPEYPQIRDFYMTQPYIHPTLIFRREALKAVNGYSEDKHQVLCEDYDLLLRLYAKGYLGKNLPEELLDYTIPAAGKGKRKMRHRWNEVVTRLERFRELGEMPKALPYVVKPIAVELIPQGLLSRMKTRYYSQCGE